MGSWVSSLFRFISPKRAVRLIMVGLDGAGKTSILYKLKLGEFIRTTPTIGFNVETVIYKHMSFTVFDVTGNERGRAMWKYYYSGVEAAIFVVDASESNADRLEECRDEINCLIREDDLRNAALLVLANKQDLPNALSPYDLAARLDLLHLKDRFWTVQACSAKNGDGIREGLEWLAQVIREKHKVVSPRFPSSKLDSVPAKTRSDTNRKIKLSRHP